MGRIRANVSKAKNTDKVPSDIEDEILPTQESVCLNRSPTKLNFKLTHMQQRVTEKPMTSFSEIIAHPKSVEEELKELVDSQRNTIKVLSKKLECAENMVNQKERVIQELLE